MLILLFFAFLSGLVTILAPCIWPLLPIILSSSVAGTSHKRPLGITLGIMLSFGIFTLTISFLVMLFHFDPDILRLFAVIVIGFLGFTMVIPSLSSFIELFVSRLSSTFGQTIGGVHKQDFLGGLITGFSLGIVWSPCAGPILASIAALAATGKVSGSLIAVTTVYLVGVGIPLFIFAYAGQQFIIKTRLISKYTGIIQQVFGILMILTAIAIYTNYDKIIQAKLLDLFPSYTQALTSFENDKQIQQQLHILKGNSKNTTSQNFSDLPSFGQAPDFTGGTNWLNVSLPLTIGQLKGKVVLVDFWTYTCINCIRTLPFVTSWYDKYKDKGFVVIGVHTPEFEFEKKTENVENAIKQYNIHYPVVQDNNYDIWNAYGNQSWPAEYLIDAKGVIRRSHFGEGEYDQTEMAIKSLLEEKGASVDNSLINKEDQTPTSSLTPETYIGSSRRDRFGSIEDNGVYTIQRPLPQDYFGIEGDWEVSQESAVAKKGSVLEFNFTAQKVFLVITPKGKDDKISVLLDGKKVDESNAGTDVKNGIVQIDTPRLYNLIDLRGNKRNHMLRLEFQTDGTQIFAFTFG